MSTRLRLEALPVDAEPGPSGAGTRPSIELPESGVVRLGRDPRRCDFALEGDGVAAVHCAIGRLKDGGWALKDLGSELGTQVNGSPCTSVRLQAGDEIALGSRRLVVVDPSLPTPTVAPQRPVDAGQASRPAVPSITGYRIGKLLGRGGMGEVYSAVQESLQRPVALKVVSARFEANRDFVDRFVAEARAAASLSHPNVVTVHDVGEESGQHYLSMEYMEGGNLEERVTRDGPLPADEAIRVLRDATCGLVFAELRGIVHRDIKPANLMQDSFGNTKIADLGLATQIKAQSETEGDRKIFGTPHFISPEQARGERVDCRSDLYSLGATLYRLLSGRTPFEGQSTREILRGHFQERPRPLTELVPELPPELSQLVARLLEKDPGARYPSASALLLEVEQLCTSFATAAVPAAGTGPRMGTWVTATIAVAALAAILWVVTSDDQAPGGSGGSATTHAAPDTAGGEAPGEAGTTRAGQLDDARTATASEPQSNGTTAPEAAPGELDTSPPIDDDSALKLFERRAEEAYAELPADLTHEGRRAALAQLARQFAGTTAAGLWTTEMDNLRSGAESAAERALPGAQQLLALRRAAGAGDEAASDGSQRPLAEAWPAMLELALPPALAADPAFQAQRALVFDRALAAAQRECEQQLTVINGHASRGEFGVVEDRLGEAREALGDPALPDSVAQVQLPHLASVTALADLLEQRLAHLDDEREAFRLRQIHLDSLALAAGFGGPDGLEGELASLRFKAATARLSELEPRLATEAARTLVGQLAATVRGGQQALESLSAEFQSGGWRRKQVPDPRSRTRASYTALAVSAEGLRLRVGASEQRVPWAAFGAQPEALHHLFHERLARDYTPAELTQIAGLVRTAAVVRAVRTAARRLGGRTGPGSGPLAGFEEAQTWADLAGSSRPMRREAEAAQAFAAALDAGEAGSWSRSVERLELLLDEYGDTLFVRLISDGSGWEPGTRSE